MSLDLEERNFQNLIHFNAPELRRVQRGENPFMIFNRTERSRLIRSGILRFRRGKNDMELTAEAREILDGIKPEKSNI